MKKLPLMVFCLLPGMVWADAGAEVALNDAIEIVRTQCRGISAKMEGIKKMAGIGTAVNAVGTVAGAGGVAAGVVKYNTDVSMAKTMGEKAATDELLRKLKEKELSPENQLALKKDIVLSPDFEKNLQALVDELNAEESVQDKQKTLTEHSAELQNKINEQQKKSITAGNVRTGLFAVDTVSNVTGAVVSSKTVADKDFIEQIKLCTESMDVLRNARTRLKVENGADSAPASMERSQKILDKCSEYEYVNVQQLNNLGKGAMISNSVGAATGTVATITSALGNDKKLSEMDFKTEDGIKQINKYEKVNVASNIIGGVTAAASLSGTVLNASQIKTAKQILNIAQECEEALQ